MKKYFLIALGALLCFAAGCAGADLPDSEQESSADSPPDPAPEPTPDLTPEQRSDEPVPDVITGKIEMEDGGVISFELYPDIAPESVKNFVFLARQGFYDGLKFHRIMDGFMIQGGCPDGTGTGGPGHSIIGEFEANNISNNLSHTRGVISMARSTSYDSAGSQFFICHGDPTFLDGGYAAFGRVTDGMDVVDRIVTDTPSIDGERVAPGDMPVIKKISIDGDFALDEPKKLPR